MSWHPGDPIDYADPNCTCNAGGMGRHADCHVHGLTRDASSKSWPMVPGVPATGHVTDRGYWHPGKIDGCPKCPDPEPDDRCPACGLRPDGTDALFTCHGHDDAADDPRGWAVLTCHNEGNHIGCHPAGCEGKRAILAEPNGHLWL